MIRTFNNESYSRILAQIANPEDSIWVHEGEGEVRPEEINMEQALRDATLPELEQIIRQMNQAYATLDFEALGEEYVYLFQNALESIKQIYEDLHAQQQMPEHEEVAV